MASPISAGLSATVTPTFFIASIFDFTVLLPPEIMVPAWPIRLSGGAVTPAINPAIGFLLPDCLWTILEPTGIAPTYVNLTFHHPNWTAQRFRCSNRFFRGEYGGAAVNRDAEVFNRPLAWCSWIFMSRIRYVCPD